MNEGFKNLTLVSAEPSNRSGYGQKQTEIEYPLTQKTVLIDESFGPQSIYHWQERYNALRAWDAKMTGDGVYVFLDTSNWETLIVYPTDAENKVIIRHIPNSKSLNKLIEALTGNLALCRVARA